MRVTVTELKRMIAESVAKNITKEQVAAASAPPARAPMASGAARGAAPSQSGPRPDRPMDGATQAPAISAFIARTAAVIRDLTSRGRPGSPGTATRSQLSLARRVINQTPDYATNRQAQAQAQSYLDAAKASIARGIQQSNQKISEIDRYIAQSSDARRMSDRYESQTTGLAGITSRSPSAAQSATMANTLNTQQRTQLETIKQMLQTQILPVYQNLQATISPLNATNGGRVLSAINNPRTGTQLLQNMENQLTQTPVAALLGLRAPASGEDNFTVTEGVEEAPPEAGVGMMPRRPGSVRTPEMPRPAPTPTNEIRRMVREVIEEMMKKEEQMDEAEKLEEAVRKIVRQTLKRSGK